MSSRHRPRKPAVWNEERLPVFIHVPKTGGSSINHAIKEEPERRHYKWAWSPGHAAALFTRHRMGPGAWDRCFRFSFVRNPWDRAVSWFYYHHKNDKKFPAKPEHERQLFREFVRKDLAKTMGLFNRAPYSMFHDADGGFMMSFVGNFEHFEEDWRWVANKINCPNVEIGHVNPSQKRRGRDYRELWHPDDVRIIEGMSWWEIQMWGYKFDTPMPQRYPHFSKPSRRIL